MLVGGSLGFWQRNGLIQSTQQVTVTIANGQTSGTATITAIDTTRTSLIWGGSSTTRNATYDGQQDLCGCTLTNSTTVTATRSGTTNDLIVQVSVVQWKPGVTRSIQYGSIALGNGVTSNTATITSVTTANAACHFLGLTHGAASASHTVSFGDVTLTNATTVTSTRNTSSANTCTVYFCVTEFAAGVLQSATQHITIATSAASSATTAITSSTVTRTLLLFGGFTTTTTTAESRDLPRIDLTNATTVTINLGGAFTSSVKACVVEFKTADLKQSMQRGTIVLTSVASNTATITSVGTTKAFVSCLGHTSSSTSNNVSEGTVVRSELTNATTVTATAGSAHASTKTLSYEVMEST